ncbi:MAG: hypothetical protein KAR00_02140 [Candidatus Pacebacteria bacterium]|nr:hypothetical protein [Candidatus Paceibacterota bacterium]
MPKNIVQDVVPPEKRSIRNIPLPNNRSVKEIVEVKQKKRQGQKIQTPFLLWFIAFFSVAVLFFAVGSMFVGATVRIVPKQEKISFSENTVFLAQKKGNGQGLQYEIVTISKEGSKGVSATEEKYIEQKASGQIVIYNTHDANSQRLIKNTRFETPGGLIYRINESVTIPGKKGAEPGSIEVTVYADEPGEKYNIGLADFSIPGFAGTARFDTFYARSKTPMADGFVGNIKDVSDSVLSMAKMEIQNSLKTALAAEVARQIPENFILYSGALFFTWNDLPQNNLKNGAEIRQKGTIQAIIFDKALLSEYISNLLLPEWNIEAELRGMETLVFVSQDETFNPEKSASMRFVLKGDAIMTALFNEGAIKEALAGKPKNEVHSIFESNEAIAQAKVTVVPFWRRTLPDSSQKIRIKVVLD